LGDVLPDGLAVALLKTRVIESAKVGSDIKGIPV
jgi:hypothetical protein